MTATLVICFRNPEHLFRTSDTWMFLTSNLALNGHAVFEEDVWFIHRLFELLTHRHVLTYIIIYKMGLERTVTVV